MSKLREDTAWTGFRGKTLWDWLELLIIPAVLTFGVLALNLAENERSRKAEKERAETQLKVEEQRAKESTLQSYLDRMTALLVEGKLRTSERDDEVRSVARARTLTALSQLDGRRKGFVLRFLYESELISVSNPIITLGGAILGEPAVSETVLSRADLNGAKLNHVFLEDAYLTRVHLIGADLRGSHLKGVNLIGADLREADLTGANLRGARLFGADLRGVKLDRADLSEADLRNAKVTPQQLASVKALSGATMPDGTKHE